MAAASDVIMLLWLPWKPIKQQVVSINWNYKEYSLYVSNIQSIGWTVSKVERRGPIDPPPICFRVTIFTLCLLGLTNP